MKEERNKEQLLKKYYDGNTTLAEEKWLKEHVLHNKENIEHFIFNDLDSLKKEAVQDHRTNKKQKRTFAKVITICSLITSAACMFFFIWKPSLNNSIKKDSFENTISEELLVSSTIEGSIEDPEIALEQAKKALAFVSKKLNSGTESIHHLNKLNHVKD